MPKEEVAAGRGVIRFRQPTAQDGAAVWRLVNDAGTLDRNSSYAYILLCQDFAATCVLAERADRLLGFVTAYRPPPRPQTIFVWQVGVSKEARGEGIAGRMLAHLLQAEACRDLHWLETTVTHSNSASRALFRSLARRLDTSLEESPGFGAELFPEAGHESEPLLRIGPFDTVALQPEAD